MRFKLLKAININMHYTNNNRERFDFIINNKI